MTVPYVWTTKVKRKSGTRHLVRWMEPDTGRNPAKTFRRLEDAREFAAKLRQEFRDNEYHAPVKIGYDEWVESHLKELTESPDIDLAPKTIAGHKEALTTLGRICNPKNPIAITPKMIRDYRRIQLGNSLTARTINKHISALRSALSYAVRAESIPVNKLLGPLRLMLREEQKECRILEVCEVTALLNAATDLRQKTALSLAYYHGMRRGEICNHQWQDIDLEDNRLSIVSRIGARTKSRRSRSVALRQESAELLAQIYKDRVNEYVFEKPGSFYWSINKWFPRMIKAAGIDHCTLHDLRKTCNTLMKDRGVSLETAMQILGHSSVMVNQKHYTGTLTEQQKSAIKSIPSAG
jgi:integrase